MNGEIRIVQETLKLTFQLLITIYLKKKKKNSRRKKISNVMSVLKEILRIKQINTYYNHVTLER